MDARMGCVMLRRPGLVLLVAGALLLGVSCGSGDLQGPDTGSVAISTITGGPQPDADGYVVSVDGGTPAAIPAMGSLQQDGLQPGSHTISLAGLAPNCTLEGDNPRQVTVVAGATAATTFTVRCHLTQGSKIAFESDRDGSVDVFVMNADGTEPRNLTSNPAVEEIGPWSPDGSKLAFGRDRSPEFETDILVMNADGSGQTALTQHAGINGVGSWSPDGRKIAFQSERDGEPTQVYVMNADGSGQTRLTNTPGGSYGPSWSPDGRLIKFQRGSRIFVMNPDGSGQTPVTAPSNTESDGGSDWSPDGRKIAFQRLDFNSDQNSVSNLWIVNPDGSALTALTHYPLLQYSENEGVQGNSWDPDGSKLAFATSLSGAHDIWIIGSDGTGLADLTNSHDVAASPLWSPDGTRILLSGTIGNVSDVFVMDADGSHLTDLTNNPAGDNAASWQP